MKEVKTYECDFDYTPTEEEVKKCIEIAKETNCIVHLIWRKKWSGKYERHFYGDENAESKIKEIKSIIYGL